MKILLVGSADTIFLVNYNSYLKKHLDAEIHTYSPFPRMNNYDSYPYDYVYFEKEIHHKIRFIKKLLYLISAIIGYVKFINFLKKHKNEEYDIIHFHRILPSWVVPPFIYKKYCKKTVGTFWGGEIESETIFLSHKLYLFLLRRFVKRCDYFINTFAKKSYTNNLPNIKKKAFPASFGSSIIGKMNELNYSNIKAKELLGIPVNKRTILLGYSGKILHKHCEIIDAIISHPQFNTIKKDIHIINPMTRAGNIEYCKRVEQKLKDAQISYTTIIGQYSTDKDVATLRMATDIVFQLSDFDGLSASIRECICAGSILISGKWLDYNTLKKEGFTFYEVEDFNKGIDCFYEIYNRYEHYHNECKNNKIIGKTKYSWDTCIIPWAEAYKKILSEK